MEIITDISAESITLICLVLNVVYATFKLSFSISYMLDSTVIAWEEKKSDSS
jgi:hypothetical protein